MARMATEPSLRTALIDHLADTIVHVARLEDIFYGIDVAPRAKVCRAMEGLLAAGEETARQFVDSAALDAALICTAQKIEHYEIATYGTLRAFAEQLELTDVQRGITLTLREESASDRRLSLVAVREANTLAAASE
jgi:ferritin-like metal-binding protein YciE